MTSSEYYHQVKNDVNFTIRESYQKNNRQRER